MGFGTYRKSNYQFVVENSNIYVDVCRNQPNPSNGVMEGVVEWRGKKDHKYL